MQAVPSSYNQWIPPYAIILMIALLPLPYFIDAISSIFPTLQGISQIFTLVALAITILVANLYHHLFHTLWGHPAGIISQFVNFQVIGVLWYTHFYWIWLSIIFWLCISMDRRIGDMSGWASNTIGWIWGYTRNFSRLLEPRIVINQQ
ncbi:hypothetical protein DFH29DRAFT_883572 [Suillus ampliporus]|nr:hypothetical protein DFH29DRAFT_883572 [Suillus ampliporus]